MLALTRKKGEALVINNNIEITVLEIRGDQIIVNSLWALFMKMQVSVSEATDCLRKINGE